MNPLLTWFVSHKSRNFEGETGEGREDTCRLTAPAFLGCFQATSDVENG